jgi:hypothetical protein
LQGGTRAIYHHKIDALLSDESIYFSNENMIFRDDRKWLALESSSPTTTRKRSFSMTFGDAIGNKESRALMNAQLANYETTESVAILAQN